MIAPMQISCSAVHTAQASVIQSTTSLACAGVCAVGRRTYVGEHSSRPIPLTLAILDTSNDVHGLMLKASAMSRTARSPRAPERTALPRPPGKVHHLRDPLLTCSVPAVVEILPVHATLPVPESVQ